jgi:hypothetical protein
VSAGGEGTADPVAVHAGWAAFYDLADGRITIGRRVGSRIVPEAFMLQRVDEGS